MSQRQHLHRQILLDDVEHNDRFGNAPEEEFVEEFIAKFMRAVRRIEERRRAS